MKKTAWNLLLTLPMSIFLLVLAASTKSSASERGQEKETTGKETLSTVSINIPDSDNVNQIITQKETNSELFFSSNEFQDSESQLTSVSQLSDVQPTDWAFQALQSLVERYGCIAGYPDSTFKGNRALSRYEFAAGLNACLDQVNKLIASSTSDLAVKEDLEGI
ncbi:MAG: iron uptake porin, partial [Sphaerospermopsis kisseleviana]